MNFNIDPKALVKTGFVLPNTASMTARQTVEAHALRTGFAQTLAQLQSKTGVNSSTILNPKVPSVAVQDGDTLSAIVKREMQVMGKPVSHNEATRLAQDVARANGISNPDRIYPGQRLNLSSLSNPTDTAAAKATLNLPANSPATAHTALSMNTAANPKAVSVMRQAPVQKRCRPPGAAKNPGPCRGQRLYPG